MALDGASEDAVMWEPSFAEDVTYFRRSGAVWGYDQRPVAFISKVRKECVDSHDKISHGFSPAILAIGHIVKFDVFGQALGPDRPIFGRRGTGAKHVYMIERFFDLGVPQIHRRGPLAMGLSGHCIWAYDWS